MSIGQWAWGISIVAIVATIGWLALEACHAPTEETTPLDELLEPEDTGVTAMRSTGFTETSPGVWEAKFQPRPDVMVMLGDDSISLEDIPVADLLFMGEVLADIDDLPTTEEAES